MATTKKNIPVKKISKSSSKNAKITSRPWSVRFSIITIGIYGIVVATLILAAFSITILASNAEKNERISRIKDVYKSIAVEESCSERAGINVNIFGDKRVYPEDKGRTFSSSITCSRGDTVTNTAEYFDRQITQAGFTKIDEPYPGSVFKEYHYKNDDGVYVRLTVSSKPYDDTIQNETLLNGSKMTIPENFDTNAGPSNVTVKVNLDDNNE